MAKFKLFGDRVLVEKVPTKKGSIIVPESNREISRLGRVVEIGNGRRHGSKEDKPIEMLVKVGDIVYFQTNAIMQTNNAYEESKDRVLMNLLQGELIARLDSDTVTYAGFEPLGEWVLVKPFLKEEAGSKIFIPETATQDLLIYFRVVKIGSTANLEAQIGDEVIVTKGRCNPIQIEGHELAFVHRNEVHGVVEDAAILTATA